MSAAPGSSFNILGPLSNPGGVKRQLIGVFSKDWVVPMAETLLKLGSERAWVMHGDGLDEITTTGVTSVASLENGRIETFEITPEDAGVPQTTIEQVRGGDPEHNAAALRAVLDGAPGPYRDIVLMNAAGALIVSGKAQTMKDGVALAAEVIDSGKARAKLDALVAITNRNVAS
jgi:anthranilate phosphoribosyltransferase